MTLRVVVGPLALLALVTPGCASSGPGATEVDAAHVEGGVRDTGAPTDTGPMGDTGPRPDTGPIPHDSGVTCPSGQHACVEGCITDQPNDPSHGCRLGCGEGCPTPAMGIPACSMSGGCDFTCPMPFHRVGDTCVCQARTCMDMGYMCGSPDDGCGMPLNCGTCAGGALCNGGVCGCMPDTHEPNDSNAVATHEPELSDASDPNVTLSDFTIDHVGDVDWIQFHIVDGFDGGNPHMTVRLYGIPSGSDYDLGVWYACDNNDNNSSCSVGTQDNMIGHGCISSHTGIAEENVDLPSNCGNILGIPKDASGILFIRVTAPTFNGACMPYSLDVRVR